MSGLVWIPTFVHHVRSTNWDQPTGTPGEFLESIVVELYDVDDHLGGHSFHRMCLDAVRTASCRTFDGTLLCILCLRSHFANSAALLLGFLIG